MTEPSTTRRQVLTATAGVALPLFVVGAVAVVPETADAAKAVKLIATKKVPIGGGVVIAANSVVVTRPKKSSFHVFSAICTHQGCTVGSVGGGVITCPCHQSRYSASTGAVIAGPAPQALAKKKFTIKAGFIYLG